jgi:hypothetical protein
MYPLEGRNIDRKYSGRVKITTIVGHKHFIVMRKQNIMLTALQMLADLY